MKTSNIILFIFTLNLLPVFLLGQTVSQKNNREWSLSDCVNYGMEHNLNLAISDNLLRKEKISYQQSIWQIAPSVNGWSDANLNLNRSTDQNNQISSGSTYSANYGISASLNLFNGFSTLNQISAMKFNKLAYAQQNERQKNLLYIEILKDFALASYNKQQVKIASEQANLVSKNKAIIESKVEVGLLGTSAIDEINATLSGNQFKLNKQKNTYQTSLLALTQLIDLPDTINIELSESDFENTQPDTIGYTVTKVYNMACQNLPDLKEKEYRLGYYKKVLRINQGQALPSLSLNGRYYSAYYSTDTLSTGKPTSLNDQYNKYLNPSISLSLNIPIFNKLNNEFQIKKSMIDLENALIELEQQKKEIFKEIQNAILQLNASLSEYQSAKDNLVFVSKSFDINSEKYTLGLITSTDYITAQNQLQQAKTEVLTAKYNWIIQEKTIKIYCGLREF